MFNLLIDKSYSEIVFIYCFFGLAILYGLFLFFRTVTPHFVVQDVDADFMSALHAGLFTITFLTLGYSLSNVSDTMDNFQHNVVAEANDLKTLDELLTFYDAPESLEIRQDLRTYAKSIAQDEWPMLLKGKGSDKTLSLQRTLRGKLQKFDPKTIKEATIYSQMLETVAKVVQHRSSRILDSGAKLAPQFLITNHVGYLGVLIMSALMLTRFTWFRLTALTVQVIAVSFIFASTIALDDPLQGTEKISTEPILNIAQSEIKKF